MTTPDDPTAGAPAPGGPTASRVWPLAWPTMLSMALNSSVGLADFLIVGQLGAAELAAAGVAHQLHFMLFGVMAAVTTGTVALVARACGASEEREADRVLRLSCALGAGVGALTLLVLPFADAVIGLFGVEPEVAGPAARYLRILFAFNVPFAIGLVVASGLRGAGDVRTPLWIGAIVNVANVFLNFGLVFGRFGMPELGLDGSALGTGIALTLGTVILFLLWWRDALVLPRHGWLDGFDRERARRILRIGVPTAIEQTTWQLGLILFLRVIAGYGTEAISAYLIGVRILSFSFVPGIGFATAASTLVGQYLGAGRPEEAARFGWRSNRGAMIVMGAVGLTIIGFARPLAGMFGAAGDETVDLTVTFIYILGAVQPLMAVEFALGGALRGAGDTRFPLVAILTGLFVFRLGSAFTLQALYQPTIVHIWLCLISDYAVKALMLTWRFGSGRWQTTRV
ncbi:MAG: MATE family efflux transporter [Myxococcales bacterium]|nr:MATE family efflux transporter [Myxococcales bacterium]